MSVPSLFVLLLLAASTFQDVLQAGPFDIDFQYASECPDVGLGAARFKFRARRIRRGVNVLDMNVTATKSLDDSYTMIMDVAQLTNGGWKDAYFRKDFPKACKTMEELFPLVLEAFRNSSGFPKNENLNCPLPIRNWTLVGISLEVLSLRLKLLPVFVYSKYRAEISLEKKRKRYACLRIFVNLVPQKHKRSG